MPEVFARFSAVGCEKGSAPTAPDPRGFAATFYTEEGNYDLVGNNTPVFFMPLSYLSEVPVEIHEMEAAVRLQRSAWGER